MIESIKKSGDHIIKCEVCDDHNMRMLELSIVIPVGYYNAEDEHHVCINCIMMALFTADEVEDHLRRALKKAKQ